MEADEITTQQPDSPEGYLLRAVADIDRKQFTTAEENIKRSLQKSADNAPAYVQLGNLRIAQNNPAEAQKAFRQALDQDPNSTDALGGVLNGYLTKKPPELAQAVALATAQLAKYPNNAGFHIILGRLLFEQKEDATGAEAEFRRAAELDKNNVEERLGLGRVQSAQGKSDQALAP